MIGLEIYRDFFNINYGVKRLWKLITYRNPWKYTFLLSNTIIRGSRYNTKKKLFVNDVAIKKISHYTRSNSSIFEGFSVKFTLISGFRGIHLFYCPIEKSNFSLFLSHFFQNISRNSEKKIMVF